MLFEVAKQAEHATSSSELSAKMEEVNAKNAQIDVRAGVHSGACWSVRLFHAYSPVTSCKNFGQDQAVRNAVQAYSDRLSCWGKPFLSALQL